MQIVQMFDAIRFSRASRPSRIFSHNMAGIPVFYSMLLLNFPSFLGHTQLSTNNRPTHLALGRDSREKACAVRQTRTVGWGNPFAKAEFRGLASEWRVVPITYIPHWVVNSHAGSLVIPLSASQHLDPKSASPPKTKQFPLPTLRRSPSP